MAFFPVDRNLGKAPRFTQPQGPTLQVPRPGHTAQTNQQYRSPHSRVSTARSQELHSTTLEKTDPRPCSIALSESEGSGSASSTPHFTIPSPSPSPSPRYVEPLSGYEVPPPQDYRVPPPYSQLLISETTVYEYRTSGPHPEAGSYRYDAPGEQEHIRRGRETRLRERGNTHREFYQNPNSSRSSDIPHNARRERTYRDGLVEIDDDWRYRDLGHMYRGEEVDRMRRNRVRDHREERGRRQCERENERYPRRSYMCVIL